MKIKKILMIIITLIMILTIFPVTASAKNQDVEVHNKQILEKVKILQNYAEDYINKVGLKTTSTDLCMQYMRKDRYNTNEWNTLLGRMDIGFLKYLESMENVPTFGYEVLIDPNTGKEIDFVHMITTLCTYLKHGDAVMFFISTDYAGWAGDLITLLEEVTIYRLENKVTNKKEIQQYSNSLLGTNNFSTFPDSDILADLDAIALYKDGNNRIKKDLYDALYKYYISVDSRYNAINRLQSAQTFLGSTKDIVKQRAKYLLTNTAIGRFDIKNSIFENSSVAPQVTTDDIDIVSQSFANYIYGVPYLKLQENKGTGTVGKSIIDVKIIESNANLKNANIEIENNEIANAEINGEYLRITPLEAGKTKITVYSEDKTTSSTYELTSNNVAPKIIKNLAKYYKLKLNEEKTFSIEAEGTNNIYTWYLENPKDGTFDKVAETRDNTYKMSPTLEMNNAKIKCGVKNKGNSMVYSNVAQLVIDYIEKDEEINSDNTIENSNNNINPDNSIQDTNNNINQDNGNMSGNKTEENSLSTIMFNMIRYYFNKIRKHINF